MKNVRDDELLVSTRILYMSPRMLSKELPWWLTLCDLEKRNVILLICIDKAHAIEQQGCSFRPEFSHAIKNVGELCNAMSR